jgi:L-histidine N-alpha-methyltransferase
MSDDFASDVREGLTAKHKHLASKYFYDEEGSRIFQQIMALDEYYLTNCEFDIFSKQKEHIRSLFHDQTGAFDLIEFGAGDGLKTRVLLTHFLTHKTPFTYIPIDISNDALVGLKTDLCAACPDLCIHPIHAEYFTALEQLQHNEKRKVVLFLGSNIGNFRREDAIDFFSSIRQHLNKRDLLMVGIDLKKDPKTILNAYDDKQGVTKAFNINLLYRMNRELEADFDTDQFNHYVKYDPVSGEVRSYLVSKIKQEVYIKKLDLTVSFDAWEMIHTEISKKYDINEIEKVAIQSGFTIKEHLFDDQNYYTDSVWEVK